MKNLFICNTVYQVFVANCIRKYLLKDEEAGIIISDHTKLSYKIYERMKDCSSQFEKIYFIESLNWHEDKNNNKVKDRVYGRDILKHINSINVLSYDRILFANQDYFTVKILKYVFKNNPLICISLFEDGLGTYSFDKILYQKPKTLIHRLKKRINLFIGNPPISNIVKEFYFFNPDKLSWNPNGKVVNIPCEVRKEIDFKNELNMIFGFYSCKDTYHQKYIFFEDGYGDWNRSTDIEILNAISAIVGKENIIVKIHPRSKVNRFARWGYETNCNTEVPWEILSMNMDFTNKILITFYSQSVIMPYLLFGIKINAVVLANLDSNEKKRDNYLQYLTEYYFEKNKAIFFLPNNKSEMEDYFRIK